MEMIFDRESILEIERNSLADYAIKSSDSRGRKFKESLDLFRPCFQKDKERVIHSKAFRRLAGKTQVFVAGSGDHYRARLTHTLEVAQVSRGVARTLGLNEDLAEVIALAHDLGHPPFGHAGEEALNELMADFGFAFEHNEQSLRVVEKLEVAYPNFEGLNLTLEVLEGLIKHQTAWDQFGREFEMAAHLEAQVVNFGDEIAYTSHDVDDGLRAGVITLEQLKGLEIWKRAENLAVKDYGAGMIEEMVVRRTISKLLGMLIGDLVNQTGEKLANEGISSFEDVKNFKGQIVEFSEEMAEILSELRSFLYQKFYLSKEVSEAADEGKKMIKAVFEAYLREKGEEKLVEIKDYIAGMTDSFLQEEFEKLM